MCEFISDIPKQANVVSFIDEINKQFNSVLLPGQALDITILFYKDNVLCEYNFPNPSDEIIPYYPHDKHLRAFWHGVNWAKSVFEYNYFDSCFVNEERTLSQINEVFNKIGLVTKYFDKSVGGPTRICKLTPDGFSWLQNGYIL